MFDGFKTRSVETQGAQIHLRLKGDGPALLLLHGYPQTHVTWHRVAPVLAEHFTCVVPDLRGYGDSATPPTDETHTPYSKRAMAADMAEVMTQLGFKTFAVCGHDRGARVGYRLALDHAPRVTRFCSLDVVPTADMWRKNDKDRAIGAFHWMFLAQPAPRPETLIGHDPDYFLEWLLQSWAADGFEFDADAMAEYRRCFRKPEVIHASCEDYRAGATIDDDLDEADRAQGQKLECPVLFLWGAERGFGGPKSGGTGGPADPLDVWRQWAGDVSGGPVDCGHFLPEEAPDEVVRRLLEFLMPG
ncbi:MAG: alpha/beta hydrolase [Rhodospirillales bacterium]|nr:alpha/beta hydrolase [Alphaproteobacteria bacterium]MBL6948058.1 alpha/beta hydrolase [Rhodospirillales bacterium]